MRIRKNRPLLASVVALVLATSGVLLEVTPSAAENFHGKDKGPSHLAQGHSFVDEVLEPAPGEIEATRRALSKGRLHSQSEHATKLFDVHVFALDHTVNGVRSASPTTETLAESQVGDLDDWYGAVTGNQYRFTLKSYSRIEVSEPYTSCDFDGFFRSANVSKLPKPSEGSFGSITIIANPMLSDCEYAGMATVGGGRIVMNGSMDEHYYRESVFTGERQVANHVLVHEVGHNLGLIHSNLLTCPNASITNSGIFSIGDSNNCYDEEYWGFHDAMSAGYVDLKYLGQFSAPSLRILGVLSPEQIVQPTDDVQVVHLDPLYFESSDGVKVAEVTSANYLYSIEYRPAVGRDYDFDEEGNDFPGSGVVVRRIPLTLRHISPGAEIGTRWSAVSGLQPSANVVLTDGLTIQVAKLDQEKGATIVISRTKDEVAPTGEIEFPLNEGEEISYSAAQEGIEAVASNLADDRGIYTLKCSVDGSVVSTVTRVTGDGQYSTQSESCVYPKNPGTHSVQASVEDPSHNETILGSRVFTISSVKTPSPTTGPSKEAGQNTKPKPISKVRPTTVRSPKFVKRGKKSFRVSWKAPVKGSRSIRYKIRISKRNHLKRFGKWATVSTLSHTYTKLSKGRYRIRIYAYNSVGKSKTISKIYRLR